MTTASEDPLAAALIPLAPAGPQPVTAQKIGSPRLPYWEQAHVPRVLLNCLRDVTSSFLNTLRRWYSTVLELMNSSAAIS